MTTNELSAALVKLTNNDDITLIQSIAIFGAVEMMREQIASKTTLGQLFASRYGAMPAYELIGKDGNGTT